jgi:hypothetical protein
MDEPHRGAEHQDEETDKEAKPDDSHLGQRLDVQQVSIDEIPRQSIWSEVPPGGRGNFGLVRAHRLDRARAQDHLTAPKYRTAHRLAALSPLDPGVAQKPC